MATPVWWTRRHSAGAQHDSLPDLTQGLQIRMPETPATEGLAWIEVEVEARRVRIAAAFDVGKMGADVGLVRALVLREANVAIDAEHRASDGSGVGPEVGTDRSQRLREVITYHSG